MTGKQKWACALLLAGFVAVTADVLASGPLTRLDWAVHLFVEKHVQGLWWQLSDLAARAGGEWVLTVPLAVLSLVAAIRYRSVRPLAIVFVVCVTLVVVVPGIKILTGRTPPAEGVDLVFTDETEYPSGHAVNAIVLWGTFLELATSTSRQVQRLLPPRRRYVLVALAAGAAGLGMVGMDYHWLTDALAGWMLGAAMYIGLLAWDPFRPLREKREAGGKTAVCPSRAPSAGPFVGIGRGAREAREARLGEAGARREA